MVYAFRGSDSIGWIYCLASQWEIILKGRIYSPSRVDSDVQKELVPRETNMKSQKVFPLTIFSPDTRSGVLCKQCRPWSDAAKCGVWSEGYTVCLQIQYFYGKCNKNENIQQKPPKNWNRLIQMIRIDKSKIQKKANAGKTWRCTHPLQRICKPSMLREASTTQHNNLSCVQEAKSACCNQSAHVHRLGMRRMRVN